MAEPDLTASCWSYVSLSSPSCLPVNDRQTSTQLSIRSYNPFSRIRYYHNLACQVWKTRHRSPSETAAPHSSLCKTLNWSLKSGCKYLGGKSLLLFLPPPSTGHPLTINHARSNFLPTTLIFYDEKPNNQPTWIYSSYASLFTFYFSSPLLVLAQHKHACKRSRLRSVVHRDML
jgi:hypothetical protein